MADSCPIRNWSASELSGATSDATEALTEQVRAAAAAGRVLRIRGGDTRSFLRADADGTPLDLREHRGVIAFEPAELVLTARAGTPLVEIEAMLAEAGQCLPFEPPRFAPESTFGGVIASGLAGPSRPWRGSVRDAVLGITLLDGHGAVGRFGGQVMKNVAGYDVARLNVGAMGALGAMLDISVRVLPRPAFAITQVLECGLGQALERMTAIARTPLPISALAWEDGRLRVRLSGSEVGVTAAVRAVGGEPLRDHDTYWHALRDGTLPFFAGPTPLWRLALPVTAAQPDWVGNWLLDWGGAQRWCRTDVPAETVFAGAAAAGGHALCWRPEVARSPLPAAMAALQGRIKSVFDPAGTFNPGVLYPGKL